MVEDLENALLSQAWEARNTLYQDLFGPYYFVVPKAYLPPITPTLNKGPNLLEVETEKSFLESIPVTSTLSNQKISVLAYKPTDSRPYWMYLTAGLSNPWFSTGPSEVSGLGLELLIKTKEAAWWPIKILRRLAYYVLSFTGTLSPGVILGLDRPIGSKNISVLNNIIVWYADEALDCWYTLPSGGFGIFAIVGITEDECQFAESIKAWGTWCIQQVLRNIGVGQITDPVRYSVMQREGISQILQSVRTYAENFETGHY